MKKTRAGYVMVDEADPQWGRFWDAYPCRVSKKEARKAWAALQPSVELVDRMLTALAWQAPMWAKQGYGTPYPASWLNGERWTDEPVGPLTPLVDDWIERWGYCLHDPRCLDSEVCRARRASGKAARPVHPATRPRLCPERGETG